MKALRSKKQPLDNIAQPEQTGSVQTVRVFTVCALIYLKTSLDGACIRDYHKTIIVTEVLT